MDRSEAAHKVLVSLNASYGDPEDSLVLLHDETIEKSWGWVFFYQSKRYVDTGNPSAILAGNGPVVILRESGSIHHLGTAFSPEDEIAEFEREQGLHDR